MHIQETITALGDAANTTGLSINVEKIRLLRIDNKSDQPIYLNGTSIEETTEFSYLGSAVPKRI